MYSLPQEIEVWYIIPAVRKELARILTKKHGLTYEKAGGLLGVTKAAVSQYLKQKRATAIHLSSEIRKEIEKSADVIVKENDKAVKEILRILEIVKCTHYECEICKKFNKGIIEQCHMKPIKN